MPRVYVYPDAIRANRVRERWRHSPDPVVCVETDQGQHDGFRADLVDDMGKVVASVVYRPDAPASGRADVYVETELEVRLDGEVVA